MKLLRFVARERAVLAGIGASVLQAVVELARYDHLTIQVVGGVVAGLIARWFVTPATKTEG